MSGRSGQPETFDWRESPRAPGARLRPAHLDGSDSWMVRAVDLCRGIVTRMLERMRMGMAGFRPMLLSMNPGGGTLQSGQPARATNGTPAGNDLPSTTRPTGVNPEAHPGQPSVGHGGNASAPDGRLRTIPWVAPSRDYLLLAPAQPSAHARLLVLLHPAGLFPPAFAAATGVERLVAGGNWLVLMPAQNAAANNEGSWNWFDPRTAAGAGETAIVLAAIEQVGRRHAIDPHATFLAGMASGASLAAAVAGNAPHRFAGAAFHSGVAMGATTSALRARRVMKRGPDHDVTENLPAMSRLSTLVLHGTEDTVVSPRHADELVRQMLAINGRLAPGAPLPPADRTDISGRGDHQITTRQWGNQRQMLISGLGHRWSGGNDGWAGSDPDAPDAIDIMARFFDEQMAVGS